MGLSVFTRRDDLCDVPGRFGWDGGYGTLWYSDPKENLTGILLTQRMMDSPAAAACDGGFLDPGLSGD
jgi:CubicO group peptidase (beta-lactamase class C family)